MDRHPASPTSGGDYEYPDDITDDSDDHDLPLPGLHFPAPARSWPRSEDWSLPGIVDQPQSSSSGSSISSGGEDGGASAAGRSAGRTGGYPGSPTSRAVRARVAHAPATEDPYTYPGQQQDPWVMQLDTNAGGGASAAAGGGGGGGSAAVLVQARFLGSSTIGGGLLRLSAASSGRSLFGPFGSSSLQHRDSLLQELLRPHPPTLAGQQHQHNAQPPPPPAESQSQAAEGLSPQQRQGRGLGAGLGLGYRNGGGGSGGITLRLYGDNGNGDDGREVQTTALAVAAASVEGDDGGGARWPYLDPDPFVLGSSSSCSTSRSSSRDASPRPHPPAGPRPLALQGRGGGDGGSGRRPWYGSQYEDSQYESDFEAGMLARRAPQRSSGGGAGDGDGASGDGSEGMALTLGRAEAGGEQPAGQGRDLSAYGLGMQGRPAADSSHGSGGGGGGDGSSGSSHNSSWLERPTLAARYDGAGPRGSQPSAALGLWPLGDVEGGASGAAAAARRVGPRETDDDWPLGPLGLEPPLDRHASRARGSELSARWRPAQEVEEAEEEGAEEEDDDLRASMAGTSSVVLRGSADQSWEVYGRFSGGGGGRRSFGISFGDSSGPANRYSPLSTLGDSDLSGPQRPNPYHHHAAAGGGVGSSSSSRSATPGVVGAGHSARGYGSGGGGGELGGMGSLGGGGGTLCFTSLDSPSGPYDRRRVVLTSAHRRALPEASTPSVRHYSDGLAGMLTNAQIQEWMSQHASRLLLPRHMQEIADIVFRPPSAAPERRPIKCPPGGSPPAVTLPPPVVLGGRYPPPHVSRLAADAGLVSGLLASLPGVDHTSSRVQAVLTALQGKDLRVRTEEEEGGGGGGGGSGGGAGAATAVGLSGLLAGKGGLRPPSAAQPM